MQFNFEIVAHNIKLFNKRFPELARVMNIDSDVAAKKLFKIIPDTYEMQQCKKNHFANTLIVQGKYLHSKYDSLSEANEIIKESFFESDKIKSGCVFFGLGLGYHVEAFLKKCNDTPVVIVEPDVFVFLAFLASRNLDTVFSHAQLTLLIGLKPIDVVNFLQTNEAATNAELSQFFLRSSEAVQPAWYGEFKSLAKRNKARREINANTAKKFFKQWFQNLVKNFLFICSESENTKRLQMNSPRELQIYSLLYLKNRFPKSLALIFAGGPSLDTDLKLLSRIPLENVLVIAVDTAARAVINAGIIPDFVITGDPQYTNFLHLKNVPLSKTNLVVEAAIFPKSLRLDAKSMFMFSQDLPLENYFFADIKKCFPEFSLPILSSGGSVATSAYSLAKYLGANEIYFSGLDLSFYKKQTHFRGSTFEEATHKNSKRIYSAQSQLIGAAFASPLFRANSNKSKQMNASSELALNADEVLTDSRMQMYAWWFESTVAADGPQISVYTFSEYGLHISGIRYIPIEVAKINFEKKLNFDKNFLLGRVGECFCFDKKNIIEIALSILEKTKKDCTLEEKFFVKVSDTNKTIIDHLQFFVKKQMESNL